MATAGDVVGGRLRSASAHCALLASFIVAGCLGNDCTLLPCIDGLRIAFLDPDSGQSFAATDWLITGSVRLGSESERTFCCGPTGNAGCGLQSEITCHDGSSLLFLETPSFVEVDATILVDGVVVKTSGNAVPAYLESRPNGSECEPVCRRANVRVCGVDWPCPTGRKND